MIKGKLKNGFKYEINEKALASYEFVEAINEVEAKPYKAPIILEMIIGKKGVEDLKELLKEDGFTPIDKMNEAFEEIIENTAQIKKS